MDFQDMRIELHKDKNIGKCNLDVYHYEESHREKGGLYQCMSLLIIALMDLGLIELIP